MEKVFYKKEEAGVKKGGMNKEERHNSQRGDWSLVAAPVPNAFHYLWWLCEQRGGENRLAQDPEVN